MSRPSNAFVVRGPIGYSVSQRKNCGYIICRRGSTEAVLCSAVPAHIEVGTQIGTRLYFASRQPAREVAWRLCEWAAELERRNGRPR